MSLVAATTFLLAFNRLAVSIVAQDIGAMMFALPGNVSVPESSSRMESASRQDTMTSSDTLGHAAPVPINHFLPVPQRMLVHHRSDSVPYVYEHPHYSYPVAHSIDYPVAPSSKHLVIVSFIGLLLLFAVIQNTIATVKRREMLSDVLSARKKRELDAAHDFHAVTPEQKDVLSEDGRIRCIQRTVCLENRKLLKMFGATGKILAKYLTRGVEKSVKYSSSGWDRLVRDAGDAGIRGEDCKVLYRDCDPGAIQARDDRRDPRTAQDS